MDYPRTVILEDPKLKKLILEKNDMILEGRSISEQIDTLEKEMSEINDKIVAEEEKIDVSDIMEKGKKLGEQMKVLLKKMDKLKKQVYERKKAGISKELIASFEEKENAKKELESKRNKIALKVQKWKDRIIPMGQRLAKPHLQNEYEDYETLMLDENGNIIVKIFSHLEEWKERFKKNKYQIR